VLAETMLANLCTGAFSGGMSRGRVHVMHVVLFPATFIQWHLSSNVPLCLCFLSASSQMVHACLFD